jgi:hypothetical protein
MTTLDLMDKRAERHRAMSAALAEALAPGVDPARACALIAANVPDATVGDLHAVARTTEARLLALLRTVDRLKSWGAKTTHPRGQAARLFEACR